MSNGFQVFIEYKVKKTFNHQYEQLMQNVISLLSEFGAERIEWYSFGHQSNKYIEVFLVPTEAHFYALKKIRTSKHHDIFTHFENYVEGGGKSIQYLALKKSS
jgi:hypothetical protein